MSVQHGLTGLQLGEYLRRVDGLVGEVIIGIDTVPHLRQRAQYHRRIDCFGAELITDQDERHQEQEGVDAHHPVGERVCRAAHERIQHDRKTGYRAYDEVTRNEEVIDGNGSDAHTQRHHHQFAPELKGSKGLIEREEQVSPMCPSDILF